MSGFGRARPRLVARTYLFSLFTTAVAVAVIAIVVNASRRERHRGAIGAYLVERLAEVRGDPAALRREAERAAAIVPGALHVYDERGASIVVVGVSGRTPPKIDPGLLTQARDVRLDDGVVAHPVHRNGKLFAYGVTLMRERHGLGTNAVIAIVAVLVALLVVSFLFARSLSRPLRKLAAAAEALGGGDLAARANVTRADEFGTVGRAFDMMADRIERLVRSQRELIANVSHELRTPLSRVRVVLDLIDDGSDLAEMRGRLAEITKDFEEIERLVDDVLTAARLDVNEGGSFPMRSFHSTSLSDLLDACATRFRAMYGASHALQVVHPKEPVAIFADVDLLRRAVGNLLDNARKYSSQGSTVTLKGEGDGRHAVIEVRDNGVGISPEDLSQIFTPFFRGDRSRTRATGGVGLGLAIAKRIAEAHQGRVRIESTLGIGTTVRIELDQVPPPPER